ncbi:ATP-binding protein [Streptomyces beihaiensis]|uniref:ATP-binding protein n=1 Tax=Streptomyces beihaiensis TaxID=2984495 RepID=A0ABT3TXU6_9ACTN|nr:ATP-binding protein [Streptomyces beihaiensis]MCX3061869.1 ATP-binding protein [Streptomyces beihaiensis]
MNIDTTQPWGIALDYAGRATVTENGHTVHIRVYDNSLSDSLQPDPLTGVYPSVHVSARLSESGDDDAVLRGFGEVTVAPTGTSPVTPDQNAAANAVAAALADFETRRAAHAALCATWDPSGAATGTTTGTTAP